MDFARSSVLRRWYFLSLILSFVSLVVVRLTALRVSDRPNSLMESLTNVVDNLIAATVVSIIVGVGYLLLFPGESQSHHEVIRSMDIAELIRDGCRAAREWSVRSRSANYFTSVTLRDLVASALTTGRSVRIKIQSIDPENAVLVESYARSMSDISARVGTWTPRRARREVYASVLRAALKCREAPRVELEFGFSSSMWVMSLDLSDQYALVTCQNKGEDALLFRTTSQFFRSYCDDFDASWRTCRIVSPKIEIAIPLENALTIEHFAALRVFFDSVGLREDDEGELREIVKTLRRDHDYS